MCVHFFMFFRMDAFAGTYFLIEGKMCRCLVHEDWKMSCSFSFMKQNPVFRFHTAGVPSLPFSVCEMGSGCDDGKKELESWIVYRRDVVIAGILGNIDVRKNKGKWYLRTE